MTNVQQYANFQVELTAVDHPTDRRRWNGGPMASPDADRALNAAVDAFRGVIREHGFEVVRTGYGVSAYESPESTSGTTRFQRAADLDRLP